MNSIRRAVLSIKRKSGRFLIVLFCVFLLSVLLSSAISTNQAILNADLALRRRLPAVATLIIDGEARQNHFELTGEFIEEGVTPFLLREIGALTYVRAFDYSAWGFDFFSNELIRVFDKDFFSHLGILYDEINDRGSLSFWDETEYEQFRLKGVQYPYILDIESGLIELIDGRVFTPDEITTLTYVAIVSSDFLEQNNLDLGMTLVLDYFLFDQYRQEVLDSRIFELEIIGAFDKELPVDVAAYEIQSHFNFVNRVYVPNLVIESLLDLYMEHLPSLNPELYVEISANEMPQDFLGYDDFLFLLYDPAELVAFANTVNNLLPPFWRVEDLSNVYSDISNSMQMMNELADTLMLGTVLAILVVLGLLILLFLTDRKQEIGIYLALGERKYRIFGQLIFEAMIAAVIGMTLALFVGNSIANQVSQTLVKQDVIRQIEDPDRIVRHGQLYGMGFRVDLTHEEMLEFFDVTLDVRTTISFYMITLGTVILATTIPIVVIMGMKPKEILL